MNQSDGRCIFRIGGPSAREVLAQGLPIDIDPRVFGPGDTALTLAGHINVHFWQVDLSPVYEFAVPRSFAASFTNGFSRPRQNMAYRSALPNRRRRTPSLDKASSGARQSCVSAERLQLWCRDRSRNDLGGPPFRRRF